MRVCLGDLGAPAYKKYDTETWFPSFGAYRETHSNSNLTDYQARRFKIRFRSAGEMVFPHTISATGITDRAVLAIIENHVQPGGSVGVPEVYVPIWVAWKRIEARASSRTRSKDRGEARKCCGFRGVAGCVDRDE